MGRAYDFVVAAVLIVVSVIIHRISVELFAAGKPLYRTGADGTSVLNGAARASLWSEILIVWVPLAVILAAFAWVFIREFRRQVQTATQRGPRRSP